MGHALRLYFGNNILAESNDSGQDEGGEDEDSSPFEDSLDVHDIEWVAMFAYFDETGTHRNALDTVVAGYLFSMDGIKRFRGMFDQNVLPLLPFNADGERIFHATKCLPRAGSDEYAPLSYEVRQKIGDQITECIKASAKLGVIVGMQKEEYEKAITKNPVLRELAGDEYSVCVVRCIENLAGWLNRKQIRGRIEYVFEAGCEHQDEADAILRKISKSPVLKKRYRWQDYSFREKSEKIPQLFAADLLAWEWQRARLNSKYPQRKEWRLALKKLTSEKPHPPHIGEYETATSVGIRSMINVFYGLTYTHDGRPFKVNI